MSDLTRDYIVNFDTDKPSGSGLFRRDLETYPVGVYGSATPWSMDIPLIPREEWPERIKEKEAKKTRLSDIRNRGNFGQPIPSLNQGNKGYCWAHSVTHAVVLIRAVANLPYMPLSAYSVAATIKNFRDEGGWAALALDFIATRGIATQIDWPQGSMDRGRNNETTWKNAAAFRVTEGWMDIQKRPYDRDLTFDQVATCLLLNIPVPADRYHWGHSTCAMDLVEVDPSKPLHDIRRWATRDWNSWGDSWGQNGTGVLVGSKADVDGAVVPRVAFGG